MPASSKMLKNKQQKANRAAGIGDEMGRLPSKVKAAEVQGICQKCFASIRMTTKNIEAQTHVTAKHPTETFASCFPDQPDPTAAAAASATAASAGAGSAAKAGGAPAAEKKKKAKADLAFLDAALK